VSACLTIGRHTDKVSAGITDPGTAGKAGTVHLEAAGSAAFTEALKEKQAPGSAIRLGDEPPGQPLEPR